jgi:hypothetical protein
LAHRLIKQDGAAYRFVQFWCSDNPIAIGVPVFQSGRYPNFGKSLVAGPNAFVHRQKTPIVGK